MDKPWKVVLAFLGVFVAGAVFGGVFALRAAGKRLAERAPEKTVATPLPSTPSQPKAPGQTGVGPTLLRQFTRELSLTNAQREKIRPVVNRAAEDLQRLRKRTIEMNRENLENTTIVMERMYEDVAGSLTQDQRRDLDDMRRNWQQKVAEERRRRGEMLASDPTRKTSPSKPGAVVPDTSRKTQPSTRPQPRP